MGPYGNNGCTYFERDFPRDVDVEEMYFSMDGYELSWSEYQNPIQNDGRANHFAVRRVLLRN